MKTKKIATVITGTLFALTASTAETEMPLPDFDKLTEISLSFHDRDGWRGKICLDGSARLQRNNSVNSVVVVTADAPKGSFPIKEIHNLVKPHLKELPAANEEALFVTFSFTNPDTKSRFYIDDKEVMRTILHGLRDKTVPFDGKTCFEDVLSKYPLVPGDEPAPFVYGYPSTEAFLAAREAVYGQLPEGVWIGIGNKPGTWTELGKISDTLMRQFKEREKQEKEQSEHAQPNATAGEDGRAAAPTPRHVAETPPPEDSRASSPRRPWLPYAAAALCAICAVTVFWLFRRRG
ncbi:MAG: hypothetical protein FWG50_07365 [Kiritimatiellaeota bacterium]|nr:hypothetical protein [Kiritimatiellota bacterium]